MSGGDLKKLFHFLYTLTFFVSVVPLRAYDRMHGTESARIRETGDQDGRYEYYPTPVLSFPFLRGYIRRQLQGGRGHAVLDLGCGKGLMLLFFSRMPFDRVAGIEYDGNLCGKARDNLSKTRDNLSKTRDKSRKARDKLNRIRIYQTDATDFSLYGEYDIFYLYNPFDGQTLDRCMDKILDSLEARPRELTVFYCNPVYADRLRDRGFEEGKHFYYKTAVFVFHGEGLNEQGRSGKDPF